MLPWQKGLINKGWAICIKVLKSCMKSKYWNYVGCTDHRAKEVSHENLTCMKQSQRKNKQSVKNAWANQSLRVLGSSCSAQGFFDWLQIVLYSDLPVSYNFNLEAIQSTCTFFCLFLNPAHVPEKMIAQKCIQMVTDHTICCGGDAVCECCHPKQNANLPFCPN